MAEAGTGLNGMALREREFMLYQDIRLPFRRNAHCEELMDCLAEVITVSDREKVIAVRDRDGESLAASELLWRLIKRPNWVEKLIQALRDPYVGQDFLAREIEEKATQIRVVITARTAHTENDTICLDGHNCGETDQPTVDMPHGELKPGTELWKTFESRIIAKELIDYVKAFTFEEEDELRYKIEGEGNVVATRELLKMLLNKNHGLDKLIEALSETDLGLQDLAEKLEEFRCIRQERTSKEGAGANADAGDVMDGSQPHVEQLNSSAEPYWKGMSAKEHAKHVLIEAKKMMIKEAIKARDFPQIEKLFKEIGLLAEYKEGSIIITLNIGSIESLDTLQSLYEGGVLSDVIHKDLLTDAKLKFLREKSGKDLQNIEFGVHINPFDFQYCRMNLMKKKVVTLPNSSVESVAVFKLGSTGMTKEKYDEFRSSVTPSLRRSMEDVFVQERMTRVYDLLEHGDVGSFTLSYLELLYNELFQFINNHTCKGPLQDIGNLMSRAVRFSGALVNGYFQFELTPASPRESGICLSALSGGDRVLMPSDVWNKLLEERVLAERREVFTFSSILLQDFLMMPISKQRSESGIVLTDFSQADTTTVEHSLQNNFFHLFTNFLYQFFTNTSSMSSMEFTVRDIFHLPLQDTSKDQIFELVDLATTAAKLKYLPRASLNSLMTSICLHLFPSGDVRFLSEEFSILKKQALRAFLSFSNLPGFIESIEVYKGIFWQKGDPSVSFSDVPVSDLTEVMTLLHTGSCLGSVEVTLHTGDEGRLVNCHINIHRDLRGNRTDSKHLELQSGQLSILSPGRVSLNLSGVVLTPMDDVDVLLENIPMLPELHSLNLTKTGLPGKRYISIIRAMRSTNIQELILNENRLSNIGPLGLINIPQLQKLDLDDCKLGDDGLQRILSDFDAIPNLMEVSISANGITNNGLLYLYSALKHCKKIRALRIHENKLQDGCGMLISAIIHDQTYLEILNLSELQFSTTDICQIAKALQYKNVTKINFRKCNLSLESSERLFKSMTDCKYLQHLDVSYCTIGLKQSKDKEDEAVPMITYDGHPDAGESFLCMLKASKAWDYLRLWNCELSNSLIFKAPERLYCLNELNHLCLQQNNLNDEHAACIGICLVNSWHNLRHLNLRKNSITDGGALSLLTGIRKSVYLKELFLDMNRIKRYYTIEALTDIVGVLPHLIELDLSYNMDPGSHQLVELEIQRVGMEVTQCEGYFEYYRDKTKIIM